MHWTISQARKHAAAKEKGTAPPSRSPPAVLGKPGAAPLPPSSLCCHQSTGAAGRLLRWPELMGTGAAACE